MPDDRPSPARAPAWYRAPDTRARAWVAAQFGDAWRVARSNRLRGGIAMAVDALVLRGPRGEAERVVLKRWARPGWSDEDPEFDATREAAVLSALAATPVPAPRVLGVDPDGSAIGVPAVLMTHVDGRRPSAADETRPIRIAAMAEALAGIQAVTGPALDVVDAFRPWYDIDRVRVPAAARHPDRWRTAISLASTPPPASAPRFLHRDFHPGNTIWRGARLSGIVDWVSASTGSPAVDLAHWRSNLGTRHGIEVADRALDAYRAVTGAAPDDQAWWDLRLLLDFLDEPDDPRGEELDRFEAYLGALLSRV